MDREYYVYIMTNQRNKVLYTGVTNNIARRVFEHQEGICGGFTKKYNCTKLVFAEISQDAISAIEREKEIKGWKRQKKIDLINQSNPEWKDLSFEL